MKPQQTLNETKTILEKLEGLRTDLRRCKDESLRADLEFEHKRWKAKLQNINGGVKSNLKFIEKRIEEAERGRYKQQIQNQYDEPKKRARDRKKSDARIDFLWDLRDSVLREFGLPVPKEVTRTSKYTTFNSWSKGRPTGQGKAKFWRGRP